MFNCGNGYGQNFTGHLCKFIGETVTVFTESGGVSGCGFTGILLAVNCNFIRIATQQGLSPSNPLDNNICSFDNGFGNGNDSTCGCNLVNGNHYEDHFGNRVGSVCDIPIRQIVSFCHNAV